MNKIAAIVVLGSGLTVLGGVAPGEPGGGAEPAGLGPVASTGSGILVEPPVDLSRFTRREFEAYSATVGPGKIRRPWTAAVTPLPPRPGGGDRPLTRPEVAAVMLQLRDRFDAGAAAPVSDVGLISTHEDVNRKPMYNHVAAFGNAAVDAYLLVQSLAGDNHWGYFALVQDRAVDPPAAYFAEIKGRDVQFEGKSCFKCHSSGPLAVHPARADLVSDVPLLRAINRHIAEQPAPQLRLPDHERPDDYGPPLKLAACTKCHDPDANRGPLYRAQAHPIRMLVDFGYMPPGRRLDPAELAALRSWLETKP